MLGGMSSIPMAGDDSTASMQAIESLLRLVRDVSRTSATGFTGDFKYKKDCVALSRRVALLSHLFEEIRDFQSARKHLRITCFSSTFLCSLSEVTAAIKAARKLLLSAGNFNHIISPLKERAAAGFKSQLQSVNGKLEFALSNFPYDDFDISEDVKEQVDLVREQLKRATKRYGGTIMIHHHHHRVKSKVRDVIAYEKLPLEIRDAVEDEDHDIPVEFLCPISQQLFTDPVFVSTGQTYERSSIQRWFNNGYRTCPKSCQTLENLTLTPNHVLRSLIDQWCTDRKLQQPTLSINTKLSKLSFATT